MEFREVFGMAFAQRRNDALITPEQVTAKVVTAKKDFPEGAVRDCVVAAIALKYTQVRARGGVSCAVRVDRTLRGGGG
jgi:AICAR transformylase/IMP cyclohydrolase PurH